MSQFEAFTECFLFLDYIAAIKVCQKKDFLYCRTVSKLKVGNSSMDQMYLRVRFRERLPLYDELQKSLVLITRVNGEHFSHSV